MKKVPLFICAYLFTLLPEPSLAALNDPFPMGFSMATMGTTLWSNGLTGRQSNVPAAFLNDSLRWGLCAAITSYYDDMDNFQDRLIYQASAGGWYCGGQIIGKLNVTSFSALDTYVEQSGYLSLGTNILHFVNLSAELRGNRIGIKGPVGTYRTFLECGGSMLIPWKYVSVSCTCDHLVIKQAGAFGAEPSPAMKIGLHTAKHTFGAQGVLIEIDPDLAHPVRCSIGEEFWLMQCIGMQVSVANNPVVIGVGIEAQWRSTGIGVALVNNPVLGWSRGAAFDYVHE